MNGFKQCKRCNETKPVAEFYRKARAYTAFCRACYRAWSHRQAESGYFRERRRKLAESRGVKQRIQFTPLERAISVIWSNIRRRSTRALETTDITREWLAEQVTDFCRTHYHVLGNSRHPFQPSIDRIDERVGYQRSNVRIVWLIENYARNGFTDEQ